MVQEYLVRWKNYGPEEDSWVRHTRLQAHELVRKFENERQKQKQMVQQNELERGPANDDLSGAEVSK